jgi:hypothetical protein
MWTRLVAIGLDTRPGGDEKVCASSHGAWPVLRLGLRGYGLRVNDGYAPPERRPPLLSYTVLMVIFNALFAGGLLLAKRRGRELPEKPAVGDIVLIGVASHKLSRLIGKDKVTSPVRAPFTELEGSGGPGELEERSRGTGVRKAIGELLVCPYCLGLWVVAAFSIGLLFAPRLSRFVAAVFTALTASDFLQIAYKAAEEKGLD